MQKASDKFMVISQTGLNWSYATYLPAFNKFNYLKSLNIRCGLYKQIGTTHSVLERIK